MKRIILVAFVALLSVTVNAQEKDQFTKDTEKLMEILVKPSVEPVFKQFSGMVADDKKEAFIKEAETTLPDFYTDMAKLYMEEFTHDEIKELLKFYATPVGKKLAEKSGVMAQKGMLIGQTWGMKLQGILGKYQ
jgi:hypothetical protein